MNNTDKIINDYMPIVKKEAYRWRNVFNGVYTKEDLISHGMEAVWNCSKPDKYKEDSGVTFGQYVKKAVKNAFGQLLISAKRKNKLDAIMVSTTVEGDDGDEVLDILEFEKNIDYDLYRCIDSLPDNEYNVITKRYMQGLDCVEIGAILGVSKQSVHATEHKALDRLKKRMNA